MPPCVEYCLIHWFIPSSVVAPATQDLAYTTRVAGAVSAIFTFVLIVIVFCTVVGTVVYWRHRKRPSHQFVKDHGRMSMAELTDDLELTMSSGSGGGKPFLQQRTIAKEVGVRDAAKSKGVVHSVFCVIDGGEGREGATSWAGLCLDATLT